MTAQPKKSADRVIFRADPKLWGIVVDDRMRLAPPHKPGADIVFKFTTPQWRKIMSAVREGCAQPALFDQAYLLTAIRRYLDEQPRYLSMSARVKAWKRVARLMGKTREAMAYVDPFGWFDKSSEFYESKSFPGIRYSISTELDRWQMFASSLAGAYSNRKPLAGERNPRTELFEDVLVCWTNAGGWLRYSRAGSESHDRGKLGGPTIRYMQAVIGPVLGPDAPTSEGVRKIIERCASYFEKLVAFDGEFAATLEAAQSGRDPDAAALAFRDFKSLSKGKQQRGVDQATAHLLVRGPRRGASP